MKRRSGERSPRRVQARDEVVRVPHVVEGHLAHPRHDVHARGGVGAVRHHHAHAAHRRARRSHEVGDDVHRPAAHAAAEEAADPLLRLRRGHPVVGRAGVVLLAAADERELLGAGDVGWVAAMQVAVRVGLLVHRHQRAVREHLAHEPVVLGLDPSHQTTRRGSVRPAASSTHLSTKFVSGINYFPSSPVRSTAAPLCILGARRRAAVAGTIGAADRKSLAKKSRRVHKCGRHPAGSSGKQAGEGGVELTAAPAIGGDAADIGRRSGRRRGRA